MFVYKACEGCICIQFYGDRMLIRASVALIIIVLIAATGGALYLKLRLKDEPKK